jgi:flagellar hook assembly protein FlgD
VKLVIYNVLGEQVRVLANESVTPGAYRVEWDGTSDLGQKVTSGIYLYRLTAGNYTETKKIAFR